jgi:DNA-binding GntR family transcriptional regulator
MAEPATPKTWASAAANGPRTLGERAFEALHIAIINGDLAPGTRLRIEELAALLGMSHLPIREAIRRLVGTGLVEHVPHRGATVTELSLEDLRQLSEARLLLEPEMIRHAARAFTDDDERDARIALTAIASTRAAGGAATWTAHTNFHFALYRPCGSDWMMRLVQPLWESAQRYRLTIPRLNSRERQKEAAAEHVELLDACVAHDADRAGKVLRNHLVKTVNLITDQMGGEHFFPFV